MSWDSTAFLGLAALVLLTVLLVSKILMTLELRAKEETYRRNLFKISETESALETSRRRYLIGLKAEGVAKNRVSQLKTRLATHKQHMEKLTQSANQEASRKTREKEQLLEKAVLDAMGGAHNRDSHFLRVMKVIRQLINLDDQNDTETIVKAVQAALVEMDKNGELEITPAPAEHVAQKPSTGVSSVKAQLTRRPV
jgi:hypothetical protein